MGEIFVAIDDTDSPNGGCTTYLTFDLLSRITERYALLGYPRLVRLNPTVPWKTRGNGATVFRLANVGWGR
ncbi:MAG: DNA-binding protein, partial [Thermoplasmata archaeon]|nr:DNA-binding protein [Thermoplasmata archaeon]